MHGKDGYIKVNGNTTISIKKWSIDRERDEHDTTSFAGVDLSNRTFIMGLTGTTGNLEGDLDAGDTNGQIALIQSMNSDDPIRLQLYISSVDFIELMSYITSFSGEFPIDELETVSFAFRVTGALDASGGLILTIQDVNIVRFLDSPISTSNPFQSRDIEAAGYIALTSPPAQTNAGTETVLTFSQQVNQVILENRTSVNINYAFDETCTAGSLLLPPGYQLEKPKKVTTVHLLTTAAQNINGSTAGNVIVKGAL